MYWDFGDELFLFNINDYQDTVRLMAVKVDNGRATFVSNKLIPAGSYVAVSYGYSDFYLSDDSLYVSCWRMVEQAGKSSNHIGEACVMAGTKIIKIEEGTKSAECQLCHELTLLECEVKLAKAQEGVEIHEITLKQNDNKNIFGSGMRILAVQDSILIQPEPGHFIRKVTQTVIPSVLSADSCFSVWMLVVPRDFTNEKIIIEVKTNKGVATVEKDGICFRRGVRYKVPVTIGAINDGTKAPEWEDGPVW